MKLTKATLKRLIKEELTKEARRRIAPHPATLPQGMVYKGPEYADEVESWRQQNQQSQQSAPLSEEEMMEEAKSLGHQISFLFDDMDLDKGTLLADVDRMYERFRDLLVEFVGGEGISESRRRARRK